MKRHAEQAIRIRNRRPLPETTKTVAAELQDKFNVEAEVVESLDDVQDAEARKRIAAGDVVKGWYDPKTGKVYLYAPNIESKQDTMATCAHEVIAHKGVAGPQKQKKIAGSLWGGCRRFCGYSKRVLYPKNQRKPMDFKTNVNQVVTPIISFHCFLKITFSLKNSTPLVHPD